MSADQFNARDRSLESSLRRLAKSLRLSVSKSSRRDTRFPDYGLFAVWDDETDQVISPASQYFTHTLTLDQLEEFLTVMVRMRHQNGVNEDFDDE